MVMTRCSPPRLLEILAISVAAMHAWVPTCCPQQVRGPSEGGGAVLRSPGGCCCVGASSAPGHVVVFAGTRPEIVKTALVVQQLRRLPQLVVTYVCTHQHTELAEEVSRNLGVPFDVVLGDQVMEAGQSLHQLQTKLTASVGSFLDTLITPHTTGTGTGTASHSADGQTRLPPPDLVLVQGDTMSAFVAAHVAVLSGVPVGHIEAGLRSFDLSQPFPEEMNRQLISRMASVHFAPSATAAAHLAAEGVLESSIFVTGNPGVDAALTRLALLRQQPERRDRAWRVLRDHGIAHVVARALRQGTGRSSEDGSDGGDVTPSSSSSCAHRRLVVLTCHRRENLGEPLRHVFSAVARVAHALSDNGVETGAGGGSGGVCVDVVFPVHPNPAVHALAHDMLAAVPNVHLVPPLPYDAMQLVLLASHAVFTDSGGLLEEASAVHGLPVLLLRATTDRHDLVNSGAAVLVGTREAVVRDTMLELLSGTSQGSLHANMTARCASVYGNGTAAVHIASLVAGMVGVKQRAGGPTRATATRGGVVTPTPGQVDMGVGGGGESASAGGDGDSDAGGSGSVMLGRQLPPLKLPHTRHPPSAADATHPLTTPAAPRAVDAPRRQLCDSARGSSSGGGEGTEAGWVDPHATRLNCLSTNEITVVLTVFRRQSLQVQLDAVLDQTMPVAAIFVWQNGHHVDVTDVVQSYQQRRARHPELHLPPLTHLHSSANLRFHARFLVPLIATTQYTSVWDDDVRPQARWLQHCVTTSQRFHGAIVGHNGRFVVGVGPDGLVNQTGVGESCSNRRDVVVDFVGHTWTFPTHAASYMWEQTAPGSTLLTLEDMQFSAAAQRHGVLTVVPAQSLAAGTCGNSHRAPSRAGIQPGLESRVDPYPSVVGRGDGGDEPSMGKLWLVGPRRRAMCRLLLAGFRPQKCANCHDVHAVRACAEWNEALERLLEP